MKSQSAPSPLFSYADFCCQLALHQLRQFGLSLLSSVEVLALAAGQVVLVLLALLALPLWLAALGLDVQQQLPKAMALLFGYSALMALPVVLLRHRLLPREILAWGRSLPVTRLQHLRAHAAVNRLLIAPLAVAYAASSAACLYQMPELRLIWGAGLAMLLCSLGITWVFGILALHLRQQGWNWLRRAPLQPAPVCNSPYSATVRQPRIVQIWYRLFFTPFWRQESGIGIQQCLLFLIAGVMYILWLQPRLPLPRALVGMGASTLLLILTDRGIKAVHEQLQRMQQYLQALPLVLWRLLALARFACIIPACAILSLFALILSQQAYGVHNGVLRWYLGVHLMAQLCLASLAFHRTAARARIIIISMAVLTAIGSELWK